MKNRKHHHGDLRNALIQAGLELLRSGGPQALSIRKVATLAGVSHAAPAHHFPNLVALRTGISVEGYRLFTQSMEARIEKAAPEPRARILAAGYGYLDFAKDHTGLFNLMFGGLEVDRENLALGEASGHAYAVLAGVCAPIIGPAKTPEARELMVWALVHGLASLMLKGQRGMIDMAQCENLLDAILPPLEFNISAIN